MVFQQSGGIISVCSATISIYCHKAMGTSSYIYIKFPTTVLYLILCYIMPANDNSSMKYYNKTNNTEDIKLSESSNNLFFYIFAKVFHDMKYQKISQRNSQSSWCHAADGQQILHFLVGSNQGHQMTSARTFPTEHLSVQDPVTDRSSVPQHKFSKRKLKPVTTGATSPLHKRHIVTFINTVIVLEGIYISKCTEQKW